MGSPTSGAYHDFVIHCETRSWPVHRVVICLRSEYFRKACDGEFEEARTREIRLAGNEPDIVDRMIDYLYLSNYDDFVSAKEPLGVPQGRLVVNALVYALADQYGINPLKDVAAQKTIAALNDDWKDESFLTALNIAWTSTPQSDRQLRSCYLAFINNHTADLRHRESFFELLRSNPELMVNVVETSWDASRPATTSPCGSCGLGTDETQRIGSSTSKKAKKNLWGQ